MNEASLLIIIGLVFDIVGVLLIIGPIRYTKQLIKTLFESFKEITDDIKKSKKDKYEISSLSNKEEIDRLVRYNRDRQISELNAYPKLMIGIGFLVLGFFLQILGNWILNPPI